MSEFWSDPSSTSMHHVCEQRRLWRDCAGSSESSMVAYKYHNLLSWLNFLINLMTYDSAMTGQIAKVSFRTKKDRFVSMAKSWGHSQENFSFYIVVVILFLRFRTELIGLGKQCRLRPEQSDQCLHCLLFRLHLLDTFLNGKAMLFKF